MASNRIPRSYDALVSLAEDAADGAEIHGTAVGLSQNTAAKIRAELVALIGNHASTPPVVGRTGEYNAARAHKTGLHASARSAESNGRALAGLVVGMLKNYLGKQWNSQWAAAGFTGGSLAIPDDPLPTLRALSEYFAAHPEQQNAPLSFTAVSVAAQADGISSMRSQANDALTELERAKNARRAAEDKLYDRMTGLRAELTQLLEDDDPLWYAFGFDRPADGEQPAEITGLTLAAGGMGIVLVDWDDARRADRYRVQRQIVGVDAAPVEVNNAARDSEATLTGLPSGQQVIVTVSAVNDAGEGPAAASAPFAVP